MVKLDDVTCFLHPVKRVPGSLPSFRTTRVRDNRIEADANTTIEFAKRSADQYVMEGGASTTPICGSASC